MSNKYDDIIDLPYPQKSTRQRMSRGDRAAQFSPFAALVGYEDAVEETARLTEEKLELAEDMKAIIDAKLGIIVDQLDSHPSVTITYFVPDEKKTGGSYVSLTGRFKCVKETERTVVIAERTEIEMDKIRKIDSPLFERFGL